MALQNLMEGMNSIVNQTTGGLITIPVAASSISSTISEVTSTEILVSSSNENRVECILQNVNTDAILVKMGTGVGTTSYNFILSADTGIRTGVGGSITIDNYLGDITVICESGKTSTIVTTEFIKVV